MLVLTNLLKEIVSWIISTSLSSGLLALLADYNIHPDKWIAQKVENLLNLKCILIVFIGIFFFVTIQRIKKMPLSCQDKDKIEKVAVQLKECKNVSFENNITIGFDKALLAENCENINSRNNLNIAPAK